MRSGLELTVLILQFACSRCHLLNVELFEVLAPVVHALFQVPANAINAGAEESYFFYQ